MIVFNLVCAKMHAFEGWFACAEAFDQQLAQGMLTCPSCGDHQITRLPSGPHVAKAGLVPDRTVPVGEMDKLLEGLRQMLEDSEDVGEAFAAEARRIQREESPRRNIRGVASFGEAADLLEEGVPLLPLGPAAKKDLH